MSDDDDEVPRVAGRVLPIDQIRQKLREHGLAADEVNAMTDQEADSRLYQYVMQLGDRERLNSKIPGMIAVGALTKHEAETLSYHELKSRADQYTTLYHYDRATKQSGAKPSKAEIERAARAYLRDHPEDQLVSRGELLPLLGDMLGIIAAQATEVRELRLEVQRLSELKVAVFGRQEALEQLHRMAETLDVSGFSVEMKLSDQLTESESASSAEESGRDDQEARGDEMYGRISGVATYIAGLDTGRKVNFSEMQRSVKRAQKAFKKSLRSRTQGMVSIKVDKVERPKKE